MKITLRPMLMEDVEPLYAMHTELDKRLLSPFEPYQMQHMRDRLANWFVILMDGQSVGNIGFDCGQLGFWVAEPYRRRGIAGQAVQQVLNLCKWPDVEAGCWSDNTASRRVLERAGFQFDYTKMVHVDGADRESTWFYKILEEAA